jgi:hypothetical protein
MKKSVWLGLLSALLVASPAFAQGFRIAYGAGIRGEIEPCG